MIAEKNRRDVDQLSIPSNLIEITPQEMILPKTQLDDSTFFLNRELSWIRFNVRVLEEAQDPTHHLLERAKFLAIAGSNLDEFFMTRIPRLLKKVSKGSIDKSMDGMTAFEQIEATRREIIPLIEKHAKCWKEELLPALARQQIYIKKTSDVTQNQKEKSNYCIVLFRRISSLKLRPVVSK